MSVDTPVVVQAALGGGSTSGPHGNEAIPRTDEQLVADAVAAWDAGAAVIRLGARERDGAPSARPERFFALIAAIRERGCDAILNLWGAVAGDQGLASGGYDYLVLRPELASLDCRATRSEDPVGGRAMDCLREVADAFGKAGTAPEIQCSEVAHVRTALRLRDEGLLSDPLRFQFVLDAVSGRPAIEQMMHVKSLIPADAIWSVSATGLAQLRTNVLGLVTGGHLRTGLEDSPWLVRDVPATNEELVRRLVAIVDELDRPLATPDEAREILRLPGPAERPLWAVEPLIDLNLASG